MGVRAWTMWKWALVCGILTAVFGAELVTQDGETKARLTALGVFAVCVCGAYLGWKIFGALMRLGLLLLVAGALVFLLVRWGGF